MGFLGVFCRVVLSLGERDLYMTVWMSAVSMYIGVANFLLAFDWVVVRWCFVSQECLLRRLYLHSRAFIIHLITESSKVPSVDVLIL